MNEANAGGVRQRRVLAAFLPLVAPLLSGHSDLAIGSRPHRQAAVVRCATREFVSRSHNCC